MIMRDLVERGELTEQEAQAMMNGTTLRPPRMKEWMWPTPRTQAGSRPNGKGGKVLEEEVLIASGQRIRGMTLKEQQMWPTPNAGLKKHSYNGNNEYYEKRIRDGRQIDLAHKIYQTEGLGKLSPGFVEYLMGFPDGWTNPDISNEQLIRMNTEQTD